MPLQNNDILKYSSSMGSLDSNGDSLITFQKLEYQLKVIRELTEKNQFRQAFVLMKRQFMKINIDFTKIDDLDPQWKSSYSELLWRLGRSYLLGNGTLKNKKVAMKYFTKSIYVYKSGQNLYHLGLLKEAHDIISVKNMYIKGSEEFKNPECMYRLGLILLNEGKSTEAIAQFKSSKELNSSNGLYALAFSYEHGYGGLEKSHKDALKLYIQAAELGSVDALAALYKIYKNGLLGQSVSEGLAEHYAKIGSSFNHARSKYLLGVHLSKTDPFKAAIYFQEAIILGYSIEPCRRKLKNLKFSKHGNLITFSDEYKSTFYYGTIYEGKFNGDNALIRFIDSYAIGIPLNELDNTINQENLKNNRCAGIHNAKVYNFFTDESFVVVIYEHVISDLNIYLYSNKNLSIKSKSNLISQIASGMNHIHSKGELHTRLTCGAIGITSNSKIKIFGVGKSILGSVFERIELDSQNLYSAPEVSEKGHSVLTDIYSFGLVVYKILTGSLPSQILKNLANKGVGEFEENEDDDDEIGISRKIEHMKKQHVEDNSKDDNPDELELDSIETIESIFISNESGFHSLPNNFKLLLLGCCNPDPSQRFDSFEKICSLI